jgi:hypothetical protein
VNGENRKSKWQRVKNPGSLVLQPRDRDIINSVYEFGLLTREQIQRLFTFNCITRVNLRLRKLFDEGYLSRRFLPALRGSSMGIYYLGPEGIAMVADHDGVDAGIIKKRLKVVSSRKELFFPHDLQVNDVRITFQQAQHNQGDLTLDLWVNATDCLQEYTVVNKVSGHKDKKVFRPDGYFRYLYGGKLFGCFLEMDRSSMSNHRFKSKVQVYLDYGLSGYYQQRYGLRFFRVIVITKTKARLLNLKSITESLTDKIFWFATIDDLTSHHIFDQLWQRPGRDGNFSLRE